MKLSIIVCTRNRAEAVLNCLAAIAVSIKNAALNDAEIVVVDNGSTDNTTAAIKAWARQCPVQLKLVYEPRRGLSAARNGGVKVSNGQLIVFTDDDCLISPTYVREFLKYDETDYEFILRSGSVVLDDASDLPLSIKSVSEVQRWKKPMDRGSEGKLLGGALIGCNMAARRALIEQLGPFDEKLGVGSYCPAAEDTDYFYRAYLAGVTLECVPDMVVRHRHGRKQPEEQSKLLRNYAIGNGALIVKYLFRYSNFSRHFIWEIRNCLETWFVRKETTEARLWAFSRVRYMIWGMSIYAYLALRDRLNLSPKHQPDVSTMTLFKPASSLPNMPASQSVNRPAA